MTVTVSAAYDTKDVGQGKLITVHFSISGKDKDRYTIPEDYTIRGEITKAPLTVKANDCVLTYGDNLNRYGAMINGLMNGETASVLSGQLVCTIEGYNQWDDVFAGTKPIMPSGFSSDNYDIRYEAGEARMVRREVTVVPADTNRKTYGDPDPDLSFSFKVNLPQDAPAKATDEIKNASLGLGRQPGENAGSYGYLLGSSETTNFPLHGGWHRSGQQDQRLLSGQGWKPRKGRYHLPEERRIDRQRFPGCGAVYGGSASPGRQL